LQDFVADPFGRIGNEQKLWEEQVDLDYRTNIRPGLVNLADLRCSSFEFSMKLENPYFESGDKGTKRHTVVQVRYNADSQNFNVSTQSISGPFLAVDTKLTMSIARYKERHIPLTGRVEVEEFIEELRSKRPIGKDMVARQYRCFYEILRRLPIEAARAVSGEYGC